MEKIRRDSVQRMPEKQGGATLLEALISILIFSLGVIAIMGLQAASMKNTAESKFRADASFLANQIIGEMWVNRSSLSSYESGSHPGRESWDKVVSNTLPAAQTTIKVNGSVVDITVSWQAAGQDRRQFNTQANIN